MLGLRSKLLLALSGLLLIVLLASLVAENVMEHYSREIRQSYRDDYESVAACQAMKESIEQMDLAAQNALWEQSGGPTSFQPFRAVFEHQLQDQRHAATLPGESAATDELAASWATYAALYPTMLDHSTPPAQRRELYLSRVLPESQNVRAAAQRLIDMNLASILAVPARAQTSAERAHWAMRLLTISALLLAVLFAIMIGRFILRPVRLLTRSVHEVEHGNLDSTVPIQSGDELGTLAIAFNNMAGKLRVYRQLADDRLERTERTTQLAIDSLPDAVLVVDTAGKVELANEVAGRLVGLKPGDVITDSSLPWLADIWRRISNTDHSSELNDYESIVHLEVRGEVRHFLPRSAPILNKEGRLIGTTVVLADVTGLRRLDAMKNSLLSLVSHELRTPLTSARMVLHLVAGHKVGPLTPKQDELLSAARDDTDRLHQIVENLLDMSRIESGRALMELRPLDPEDLVREVIDSLGAAFQSQEVELEAELDPSLPQILADRTRIGHVFANLLMNSLRYTPAGGRVRIGAQARGAFIEFAVTDTGCGIPREFLHRVFEKFYRVPGQAGSSGSGLGLCIAKDIIEAHGGQIRIDSTAGAGTTVAFTLQASQVAATVNSQAAQTCSYSSDTSTIR